MSGLDLFDIVVRSSAAMMCLLTCVVLMLTAHRTLSGRMGALFALGAAGYIVCTSPALVAVLGLWHVPFVVLSWFDGIFFWWFALALFCDEFRWRMRFLYPVIPMALLVMVPAITSDPAWVDAAYILKQALSVTLILHGVTVALRRRRDDLVDARRRFRVIVAVSVGVSAILLMVVEHIPLPAEVRTLVQPASSLLLLLLTFGFAVWALQVREDMFVEVPGEPHRHDPVTAADGLDPADRPLLARLEAAMDEGVYLETGLTVGSLADRLGTPEHRLRKLINQGLGYRNFSSFINTRRVEDAKAILADPEQARRQILQVALDLGYGSIAPFNRAFREATGEAPTAFRRRTLAG